MSKEQNSLTSSLAFNHRGFCVVGKHDWNEINDDDASTCIGLLKPRDTYVLVVEIMADRRMFCLTVDKPRNITVRRSSECSNGNRRFLTKMTLAMLPDESLHVPYPQNTVTLLEIGKDGQAVMWEMALVSQVVVKQKKTTNPFFITIQRKYDFRCYRRSEGGLAVPAFEEKWLALIETINKLVEGNVDNFPPVAEYAQTPEIDNAGLTDKQGRVLWYNLAWGLGAIVLSNGETVRAHWSQVCVENDDGFAFLQVGELVKYELLMELKGKGTFKHEALGVNLVQ